MVYRESYEKTGYDPIKRMEVTTQRTKIIQDWDIPIFKTEEGRRLITRLLS
jgi:hypothetical protein